MRADQREEQLGKKPIKAKLRELFDELKTYTDEKREKLDQVDAITKEINEVNHEVEKQRKNVHPVFNEESKLEKGIRELERKLQTHSWSRQDEKKIIKEIEQVQNSRPFFSKIERLRAQIAELKE